MLLAALGSLLPRVDPHCPLTNFLGNLPSSWPFPLINKCFPLFMGGPRRATSAGNSSVVLPAESTEAPGGTRALRCPLVHVLVATGKMQTDVTAAASQALLLPRARALHASRKGGCSRALGQLNGIERDVRVS